MSKPIISQLTGEGNWVFDPWQEWSQIAGGCNWYTITPIHIEFEWDKMLGGVEMTVVLLGLGVRVRWNYMKTEMMEEVERRRDEVLSGEATARPIRDGGQGDG